MLGNPGVPGANLPAGEDHVMRRLADLERAYRELVASTAIRPGSIANDALTSPVFAQSIEDYVITFPLLLSNTTDIIKTATIATPSAVGGLPYTSVIVSTTCRAFAKNTTAVASVLGCSVDIDGIGQPSAVIPVAAGAFGFNVAANSHVITGLTPSSTFDITIRAWTLTADWAASLGNFAAHSGTLLWFR